jgi:hypothetical protein
MFKETQCGGAQEAHLGQIEHDHVNVAGQAWLQHFGQRRNGSQVKFAGNVYGRHLATQALPINAQFAARVRN